jgi:hypothetical protein
MTEDFLAELADVRAQVAVATETEHASLGSFIRHEVKARADSPLAGVVLAASLPSKDSPAQREARVQLATAMVLLDVALSLHKLLLLQNPDADTLDKSLVGGTVLAGDYCFSQAAVAAARTGNPQVVAIFSDVLKELSEAHLRHLFGEAEEPLDEFSALFRSGGLAGGVLAGQSQDEQQRTASFAASLAGQIDPSALRQQTPAHQHPRWLLLLASGQEGKMSDAN